MGCLWESLWQASFGQWRYIIPSELLHFRWNPKCHRIPPNKNAQFLRTGLLFDHRRCSHDAGLHQFCCFFLVQIFGCHMGAIWVAHRQDLLDRWRNLAKTIARISVSQDCVFQSLPVVVRWSCGGAVGCWCCYSGKHQGKFHKIHWYLADFNWF